VIVYFWPMRPILLALMVCGLTACIEDDPTAQRLMQPPEEDVQAVESFGVTFLFSDSARVSVKVKAGHVIEAVEGDEENGPIEEIQYLDEGVEVYFLDSYGRPNSTILCDSGIFRRNSGLIRLVGNVKLSNSRNERMETEELFWNRTTDSMYTDKRVRIQTPDKVIIGREGLKADTKFEGYTIYGIEGEIESLDEG